jgi:hypothetical protein
MTDRVSVAMVGCSDQKTRNLGGAGGNINDAEIGLTV